MNRSTAVWVCMSLGLAFGCEPSTPPGEPIAGLQSPEKLVVFSLDPTDPLGYGEEETGGVERLSQWRVLGKVEIDDAEEREKIVAALQDSVVHPNSTQSKLLRTAACGGRHGSRPGL